jgi:carbon storage regulator
MLVLSRRSRQGVLIGTDIVVTVLEITTDRVRLGIAAPREVSILRDELIGQDDASQQPPASSHS